MNKNEFDSQSDRLMEKLQAVDREYEAYAKAKGMTYMSMTVLEALFDNRDTCTQKLICELTHYPKQSVNLIVKAFWESGYVELKEFPSDRRNKRICFTEAGLCYAEEMLLPLWDADKITAEQMGEAQSEELLRLTTLYERLLCENIRRVLPSEEWSKEVDK